MKGELVVLPLYSLKSDGNRYVPARSGINQWNANGRKRKFGEAYIPVPSIIHQISPTFFPPRNIVFELVMPNEMKVDVKLCQSGSKALMSNPNHYLCKWLFSLIEDEAESLRRFQFRIPYSMEDLTTANAGCVALRKIDDRYSATSLPVGAFEEYKRQTLGN